MITTINLESLETVGSYVTVSYNNLLVRLNMTNVTVIESYLSIQSNPELRLANFSRLETVCAAAKPVPV